MNNSRMHSLLTVLVALTAITVTAGALSVAYSLGRSDNAQLASSQNASLQNPTAQGLGHPMFSIPTAEAWATGTTDANRQNGDYIFFTYRRNVWTVKQSTGGVRYTRAPESANDEKIVIHSEIFLLDRKEFPAEDAVYLVSERNLNNYLWIGNPQTGKLQFLRATRDNRIDSSKIFDCQF